MKNPAILLAVIGLVLSAIAFFWGYVVMNAGFGKSALFSSQIVAVCVAIERWFAYRKEKKEKGLSSDQMLVLKGGGSIALLRRAKMNRVVGYLFIALPFAVLFIKGEFNSAQRLLVVGLIEVITFPIGALVIWGAERSIRAVRNVALLDAEHAKVGVEKANRVAGGF